jgi:hypothetical protein
MIFSKNVSVTWLSSDKDKFEGTNIYYAQIRLCKTIISFFSILKCFRKK